MATQKPAVMTYLNPALYNRLVEFKQEQSLRSLSHTIEVILGEFFGVATGTVGLDNSRLLEQQDRLVECVGQVNDNQTVLYQEILNLRAVVLALSSGLQTQASLPPSPPPLPSIAPSGVDPDPQTSCSGSPQVISQGQLTLDQIRKGLKGIELAVRLRTDSSTISRKRQEAGFPQWSQRRDPDAIAWELKSPTRRFHPVNASIEPVAQLVTEKVAR